MTRLRWAQSSALPTPHELFGVVDISAARRHHFPEWLLERRQRAAWALTSVVATCYLLGVSTGRMGKLVQTLGITGLPTGRHPQPAIVKVQPPTSTAVPP